MSKFLSIEKIKNAVISLIKVPKADSLEPSPITLTIDDMIKYPAEHHGIPIFSIDKIYNSQLDEIEKIKEYAGFPDRSEDGRDWHNLFEQTIKNYIAFVGLIPASENHHHSDVGGLFRHSLEVAKIAMRKADSMILPPVSHLDEEILRGPRWVYAAFICGLLHDAGKILYDVKIFAVEDGRVWNPYFENMYVWAEKNKTQRYRVVWRSEHRHKKHENLAMHILDWILTPAARDYLYYITDDLPIAINHTLSHYHTQSGYLQDAVRTADSISTGNDVRTQWHQLIGKRKYPIEKQIVNAFVRLRDKLSINEPGAQLWVVGGELYATFPKTLDIIAAKLKEEGFELPLSPIDILSIMEDRQLVVRNEQELRYSQFIPSFQKQPINVFKFSWPSLVFESVPLPVSCPGVIRCPGIREIEFTLQGDVIERDLKPSENNGQNALSNEPQTKSNSSTSDSKKPKKNKKKATGNKPNKQTAAQSPKDSDGEQQTLAINFENENTPLNDSNVDEPSNNNDPDAHAQSDEYNQFDQLNNDPTLPDDYGQYDESMHSQPLHEDYDECHEPLNAQPLPDEYHQANEENNSPIHREQQESSPPSSLQPELNDGTNEQIFDNPFVDTVKSEIFQYCNLINCPADAAGLYFDAGAVYMQTVVLMKLPSLKNKKKHIVLPQLDSHILELTVTGFELQWVHLGIQYKVVRFNNKISRILTEQLNKSINHSDTHIQTNTSKTNDNDGSKSDKPRKNRKQIINQKKSSQNAQLDTTSDNSHNHEPIDDKNFFKYALYETKSEAVFFSGPTQDLVVIHIETLLQEFLTAQNMTVTDTEKNGILQQLESKVSTHVAKIIERQLGDKQCTFQVISRNDFKKLIV